MIDGAPRSPVFDALLDLNPWARVYWEDRLALIDAGNWNVNSANYGGNKPTQDWLRDFQRARSRATMDRISGGQHPEWNASVYRIIAPLLEDPEFNTARPGTPLKGGFFSRLVNLDDEVGGYSMGQFKADVLLLAQPCFYEASLTEALDLSGLSFTIGPWIYVSDLPEVIAHETQFGPYADIVSSRLGRFDAAGAEFYGQVGFTPSTFKDDAIFAGVEFHGGADFQAVSFDAACDFTGAVFHGWTAFAGTVFHQLANFRDAEFHEDTTFEATTYHASADFAGAAFHHDVGTAGIEDAEVAKMILAAKR